jgi:hypothetical protein
MPATNTNEEQVLEAVVSGPDGANRLFICTGIANVQMSLGRNQEQMADHGRTRAPAGFTVHIISVEADWEDESERVEVRVEVSLSSSLTTVNVDQLRYWVTVTILAQA